MPGGWPWHFSISVLISALPAPLLVFLFYGLAFTQALFNTAFHVTTTAAFGVYSPGVITTLVLYPPLFHNLTRLAYREGLLSNGAGIVALVLGGAIHALVVALQVFFIKLV